MVTSLDSQPAAAVLHALATVSDGAAFAAWAKHFRLVQEP